VARSIYIDTEFCKTAFLWFIIPRGAGKVTEKLEGQKQQSNRFKKKISYIFVVLLITLCLVGCNSLEDAVDKAKPYIPPGHELVHIEQISDNSAIVFYTFKEELSTGIFIKNRFGWEWIGSSMGNLVTYPEGLQWKYVDLGAKDKAQYYLYYGKINNKNIDKVTVKTIDKKMYKGTIVDTAKVKLWYAFVDKPQTISVSADITGYSKTEKVLYSFSQSK